jgi:dipeptidyl-peptidase-4
MDRFVFEKYMDEFGLDEKKPIRNFSKGMRRQLFIALALAVKPKYLLLDEAFDGLDPLARLSFKKAINEAVEENGTSVIISSHSLRELEDFCDWADWLMAQPYVRDEKIGIEGFSYGGMMTALILFRASDKFHYGIAGAGVYDWLLYDTHYTERYMDTPQANPDGYKSGSIINYVAEYPVEYGNPEGVEPVMLKLTHGTGDDNVHLQNSLWLINELHRHGKKFEFMIYPDGMHGYRGYQGAHFQNANREFWLKYLKAE